MDYLWAGMLLLGIFYGFLTNNLSAISDAALTAGSEAISLCITTAGVLSLWSGLMEIAQNSGIVSSAAKIIQPLITFLFPDLPKNHPATKHISLNFIANFLGLNWGATPAGLMAMEELANLEAQRGNPAFISNHSNYESIKTASHEMCTFLIINISSLQLIPISIIAYRQQYGSSNPSAIVGPAILATTVNTVVAIAFCKLMQWHPGKNRHISDHYFSKHKKKNRKV